MRKNKPKERPPWDGTRTEHVRLQIPGNFVMLCELLQIKVDQVLYEFMCTLSMDSYGFGFGIKQRKLLVKYLVSCGYGQHRFTPKDIGEMLTDLNSVSALWPGGAPMEMIERHAEWRTFFHEYWYKKWRNKFRRIDLPPPDNIRNEYNIFKPVNKAVVN